MKKRILILAGGTATAWHLSKIIKRDFTEDFTLCVGDINTPNFVPASVLCDEYYRLPAINDAEYYSYMLELLKNRSIDILVPLIDFDLAYFPCDNSELMKLNIFSTAPCGMTMDICKSKTILSRALSKSGIAVPKQYNKNEIDRDKKYFVKPDAGFGSRNASVEEGKNIVFSDNMIIQEILAQPEITVEIFKKGTYLSHVCRERKETKAGVCTKALFTNDAKVKEIIEKISDVIDLPLASCVQFMKNTDNQWTLTDLNMRLGAGTALSSAAGFCIASAFLSILAGRADFEKRLKQVENNLFVVRVYDEIVMPS
jgi:hypothetical protein